MKPKLLLIALTLFIIIILIFVWQNSNHVTLKLWFWETQITLSFVILASILIGALIYKLITIPAQNRKMRKLVCIKKNWRY